MCKDGICNAPIAFCAPFSRYLGSREQPQAGGPTRLAVNSQGKLHPAMLLIHGKINQPCTCGVTLLKAYDGYFKKIYIMGENDPLSEYNKIPIGHNCTNGAVYFKINIKVEICSAL